MPLDAEEVFALVKEGSAGRPHVAQVLVARGYVKTVREAFDKFLGVGKPGHVPRKKLTPDDAVRLLRKARRARLRPSWPGRSRRVDPRTHRRGPNRHRVLRDGALRRPARDLRAALLRPRPGRH